jgi:hypothetical protein
MILKPIEEIEKSDIDGLVAAKTAERRTLEYKESLPGGTDDEKKEFLYDVSSFANAAGGDLIFGISDEKGTDGRPTGVPQCATGVAIANVSAEIARLENMLRSGVAPRIPSVQFRDVPGFPAGHVLILRIQKSWAAPHMVTFKNVSRFYSRNSTGKYPLDVYEIRSAFALSEALPERIRQFRRERLAAIAAGETPIPLPVGGKLILHIVPIASLSSTATVDVRLAAPPNVVETPRPLASPSWDTRFNFDGLLTFNTRLSSYVQLFRSGAIEAIDTELLTPFGPYGDFVSTGAFEKRTLEGVALYVEFQKRLGLTPPFFVLISFLGVRGFKASTGPSTLSGYSIDRDSLILPDVMIESLDSPIAQVLKPVFDTVAQSAGLPESPGSKATGSQH